MMHMAFYNLYASTPTRYLLWNLFTWSILLAIVIFQLWDWVSQKWIVILLGRKTLLFATGVVLVGGTAAYLRSRSSNEKSPSFNHYNGLDNKDERSTNLATDGGRIKKGTQKSGGLKSLHALAAILLSKMGKKGAGDLLSLLGIVVSASYIYQVMWWVWLSYCQSYFFFFFLFFFIGKLS